MLRCLLLSISCLLLLAACGDGLTGQDGENEAGPSKSADKVQDDSGNGIAKEPIGKDVARYNPPPRYNPTEWGPMDCKDCDLVKANLSGANLTRTDLTGAYLTEADLSDANLTGANLTGADLSSAMLDDVIGADFTGAVNVPPKYR